MLFYPVSLRTFHFKSAREIALLPPQYYIVKYCTETASNDVIASFMTFFLQK